jgi:uncharacterized protein (DUF885 family)
MARWRDADCVNVRAEAVHAADIPEQLADEFGAHENDPVARLGCLRSIASRACRPVVDTGIHAERWTREQGVRFFVDVNGSKYDFGTFNATVVLGGKASLGVLTRNVDEYVRSASSGDR